MHGLQRVGRVQLRHAAGVVADQHRLRVALPAQVQFQRAEAVVHGLVQERVHDGRGATRVFALAPGDLVRKQDRNRTEQVRRIVVEKDFAHAQFVRRVDHAVGEHHDQRLRAGIDQLADALTHIVLVEHPEHLAEIIHALAHFADHRNRHDRLWPVRIWNVHLRRLGQALAVAARARQRNRAFESTGDQHADARSLAFDQRIGAERRRVADRIDLRQQRGASTCNCWQASASASLKPSARL